MTKSLPFALLAAGSLLSGAAAFAQTPAKPAAKTATAHATVATRTVMKTTTRTTGTPRMVTVKLANGKSMTYDCSKADNATKKACKG